MINDVQEKDFQTRFNHWLKHYWTTTAKFELKLTKKKSFPYSQLKEHQRDALKNKKVIYKIPDLGAQNPFDCFVMVDVPGYVVIQFYIRGVNLFYVIEINKFEEYEKTSKRKSLTEEEANIISDYSGRLA